MSGNYDALRFWFDVVQLAGTIGIGIYVWWDRRKKSNNKRFNSLEEIVSSHELSINQIAADKERKDTECDRRLQRITELEHDVLRLPSRDEISKLSDQIGSLSKELSELSGRLSGINRAVDLLSEHHLKESK